VTNSGKAQAKDEDRETLRGSHRITRSSREEKGIGRIDDESIDHR